MKITHTHTRKAQKINTAFEIWLKRWGSKIGGVDFETANWQQHRKWLQEAFEAGHADERAHLTEVGKELYSRRADIAKAERQRCIKEILKLADIIEFKNRQTGEKFLEYRLSEEAIAKLEENLLEKGSSKEQDAVYSPSRALREKLNKAKLEENLLEKGSSKEEG